ncbi:diguanylate cyclase (GGDEF)-like protein/PAS domain S-box-containing protein [Defluviitalea raffinosedens]|nr:diguanylate cyclase (GGDEF)-like protein/PAS domain S-box-containing protein [Defluviitalea raffinosedens]
MYHLLECSQQSLGNNLEEFYAHVHPDDLEMVKNAYNKMLEGIEYDIQYRIITDKGTEKYIHEKTSALYDIDNKPIKVFGIMQDITEQKQIEKHLKEISEHMNQAQMLSGIGSWKYDILEEKFWGSPEMFNIYGSKLENNDGDYTNLLKLIHPDDQPKVQEAINTYLAGKPYEMECRILLNDGSLKYIIAKGLPTVDQDGQVISILGTIQDITEQKRLQQEIEKIQKRFQILVQESNDVFEIIAPDGTIKYVSEASEKIIGYKPEDRIGKNIYDFYEGVQLDRVKSMVKAAIEYPDKVVHGNILFNNIYLDVHLKNLIHEPVIEGIVVNFRDITNRIKMEQKMAYISTHDTLTGLPNQTYLKKQLRNECQLSNSKRSNFALMMLDIDGLKNINYSLGYETGNKLIMAIVDRLKNFSYQEIFISRYSDSTFGIIVKGQETSEEYAHIARQLIELLKKPYKIGKYELDITVNIGICMYPTDARNVDSLSKNAKIALFRGRKEGKNRFKFYNSDLGIQNYKNYIMRTHLYHAIEKNEMKVYYQPIVNLKDNKILAAEALIRWEHPMWGMILLDEFMPLAEETGLIIDIGKWMLRQVCYNYSQWLQKGFPNIKVCIHFSSVQFMENNFEDNILDIIKEFNLNPDFLIMEITESIIMEKKGRFLRAIKKLQSAGIQLAIDDFGKSFSTLAHLHTMNIDIIKIDNFFIQNCMADPKCNIILSAIIDTAKKLKLRVVSEGIETWEQLYYLRELNCYAGQGSLYAGPVPLKEFEKMLATGKCKPVVVNNTPLISREERRKYFRIQFYQLLEASITIKEIQGKKVNVGDTKVLVKNIGPGGLCFLSNIKMPIKKHFIIQCSTQLIGEEIQVCGHLVWAEELEPNIYEYGVEFIIDENERGNLIKILNQVQIKMKKDLLFAEGNFTPYSAKKYFATEIVNL